MSPRRALCLTAALLLGSILGCQSIAGIEDRVYEPTGVSEACAKYCDTVQDACTGTFQVYATKEACHGVCALLDPGDALEPAGNTVACRTRQAAFAASTGEPDDHCPKAGPGGAGECGDNCESYCALYAKACHAEFSDLQTCVQKCAALENLSTFNVEDDHEGDTVQCRLQHVTSASVLPDPHCDHARFVSTQWCFEPPDQPPECADYCRINLVACTGETAQYESLDQCMAVCGALDPGLNENRTENTVGCRKYHSYSSLFDAIAHCSHAGPSGDGHCGPTTEPSAGPTGNCQAYCRLVEAACASDFAANFADQAECIEACGAIDGAGPDQDYTIHVADGPTLGCRVREVARAFDDPTACAGALGSANCQ